MNTETWQQRQKKWKLFLVENNIQQKDFADNHLFDPAQLSQWFNGNRRASGHNETRMVASLLAEKRIIEKALEDD